MADARLLQPSLSVIRRPSSVLNGWMILDKPSGITSAHAVAKVKRLFRPAKIGHAGTLDPLASGILPLALGEATKTVAYMMDASKSYSFTVVWGEERDTDDSMGAVTQLSPTRPTRDAIEAVLPRFTGRIQQMPPNYSAIKIEGKRAYDISRNGEIPNIQAREVHVQRLEITSVNEKMASFICDCGKGTYIRSLARDMGRLLGCYGYISELRRLRVGQFGETHAISLEVLAEMGHNGDLSFLRPVESALDDIPACDVSHDQAMLLKSGQTILLPSNLAGNADGIIVLVRSGNSAVAMGQVLQGSVKPVRVFNL